MAEGGGDMSLRAWGSALIVAVAFWLMVTGVVVWVDAIGRVL